jgi:hypothetical protein
LITDVISELPGPGLKRLFGHKGQTAQVRRK